MLRNWKLVQKSIAMAAITFNLVTMEMLIRMHAPTQLLPLPLAKGREWLS